MLISMNPVRRRAAAAAAHLVEVRTPQEQITPVSLDDDDGSA